MKLLNEFVVYSANVLKHCESLAIYDFAVKSENILNKYE